MIILGGCCFGARVNPRFLAEKDRVEPISPANPRKPCPTILLYYYVELIMRLILTHFGRPRSHIPISVFQDRSTISRIRRNGWNEKAALFSNNLSNPTKID